MCNGGCISLVMKPAPLHLQALGAKHPEPNKTTIQNQENLIKKNKPKSRKPGKNQCKIKEKITPHQKSLIKHQPQKKTNKKP